MTRIQRQYIAEEIRRRKESQGWSYAEMAALCGMERTNLCSIVTGKRDCSHLLLIQIIEGTGGRLEEGVINGVYTCKVVYDT
jgi:transcriptional regulator with XRE-family HTH domain